MPGRDPIPGYLSLHHNQNGLTLKWTPNQLMNGYTNETKASNINSQDNMNSFSGTCIIDNSKTSRFVYLIDY